MIVNISAHLTFDGKIDFDKLGERVKRFPRFPGAHYKTKGYSAMIFRSGKVNVLGCKSDEAVKKAVEEIQGLLAECSVNVKIISWRISNYVFTYVHNAPFPLEKCWNALSNGYEGELITPTDENLMRQYIMLRKQKGMHMRIYPKGKMVIIGPTLESCYDQLYEVIGFLILLD